MRFIVCIKQVPDVTSPLQLHDGEIDTDTGRLVLNAYDASAVEEALVLTERYGGSVHLVLVGPPDAQETIRKALAMGAESAVHIQVGGDGSEDAHLLEGDRELDSRAYAQILADHLGGESFDVLACGKQAQDTDAGLTGSMLAELLGLPFAANAVALDVEALDVEVLEVEDNRLIVTRQGDAGQEIVALETPCVVTCSNDMNDPRIPNLKGIMAAKRKTIEVKPVSLPSGLPSTRLRRFEHVPEREPGRILQGDVGDVVGELVALLRDEASVL